jgi:hypothetical protein
VGGATGSFLLGRSVLSATSTAAAPRESSKSRYPCSTGVRVPWYIRVTVIVYLFFPVLSVWLIGPGYMSLHADVKLQDFDRRLYTDFYIIHAI